MHIKFLFFFLIAITYSIASIVELSNTEKIFLKQHPTIILGSDSTWAPYIIRNDDGSIDGYDADILKEINKNTGANFQLVTGKWQGIVQDAINRKIYGLSTSAVHKEREKYFTFSDVYVSTQRILIVSNLNPKNINSIADLAGKRIGYQEANLFEKKLASRYTNSTLVPLNSYDEIMDALIQGKIDAIIGSESFITFAQIQGLHYLKPIAKIPNSTLNLVFSLRNDFPELKSIINKGLKAISNEKKIELKKKWFFNFNDTTNQINKFDKLLTEKEKQYLQNHPILRVQGIATFPPFNFYENDTALGYTIDYFNKLGEYLNVKFDFIINKSFPETITMFKNGEIDILPHIAQNKSRKEFVEYTNFSHIEYLLGVTVKKDIKINKFEELQDKTIAVINKAFISTFIKKHYPNQKLYIVKSTNDGVLAVANGKADAFLGSIPTMDFYIKKNWLNNIYTTQIDNIGLPDKVALPMGVQKGNLVLKSILEKASKEIDYGEILKLQHKWLNNSNQPILENLILSQNEKKYLSSKPNIKMCVLPDWLPFEQIDENGEHKGIGRDIINIISEKLNKEFILVPTQQWSESLQNIKDRKCDILPVAMDIPSRRSSMNFTIPYVAEPFVIATTNDKFFIKDEKDLSHKKIGVVKSYAFIEVLKQKNPLIHIIEVKNTKEGLEKVNSGELYGYIDTMPTIGYFIQKHGYINLKIAGKLPYDITLSIASRNDEPLLNSIIQKTLNTIEEKDIRTIVGKWIEIKVHQEFDYTKLIYVVIVFTIVLFIILVRNKITNDQKKELQQLIESSSDGVFIMNLDGDLIDCSNKACEMLGYNKQEMLKLNVMDWEYVYSKNEVLDLFKELTNDTISLNTQHKRKDGTIYDTEIYVNKITLSQKTLIYSSVRDITKENALKGKLLEQKEALENQKEELESIFNYSKDGIAVIDLNSNFIKFNQAFLSLVGFTYDELFTKSCIELTSNETRESVKEALKFAFKNKSLENFETTFITKNNTRIDVNFSLSKLPDDESYIMIIKDMTELKYIENQSRLASMGQMIGNIAHQWRQPLSVITSSASGLKLRAELDDTTIKEDISEYTDLIVSQANYLSETIDSFRSFIQQDKQYGEISVKSSIDYALTLTNDSLKNNYIQLVSNLEYDIKIFGSTNELSEAIINIINNSKDVLKSQVTNEQDRYIFISTKSLVEKSGIEIIIKDTGGGIEEDIIDKVFDPYFTTKHQSLGTGLGLSIVDKIIRERHKGIIKIYNETFDYNGKEYKGACISITFYQV